MDGKRPGTTRQSLRIYVNNVGQLFHALCWYFFKPSVILSGFISLWTNPLLWTYSFSGLFFSTVELLLPETINMCGSTDNGACNDPNAYTRYELVENHNNRFQRKLLVTIIKDIFQCWSQQLHHKNVHCRTFSIKEHLRESNRMSETGWTAKNLVNALFMRQLHKSVTDFMFDLYGNIISIHLEFELINDRAQGVHNEAYGNFYRYNYNYLYYFQARFRRKIHFRSVWQERILNFQKRSQLGFVQKSVHHEVRMVGRVVQLSDFTGYKMASVQIGGLLAQILYDLLIEIQCFIMSVLYNSPYGPMKSSYLTNLKGFWIPRGPEGWCRFHHAGRNDFHRTIRWCTIAFSTPKIYFWSQ